jgi:TolA-binding protein
LLKSGVDFSVAGVHLRQALVDRAGFERMKLTVILPWLCAAGLLAAAGSFYFSNQKLQAEVAQLRQENQALQTPKATEEPGQQAQISADELARLRKDNEDLLRLRNDVRQLRQEKQQLSTQLQTMQNQADAQARAAAAHPPPIPTPGLTPEQMAAVKPALDLAANNCINNIRIIEAAKQQWATVNQKPPYTLVAVTDITPYLPRNMMPVCPSGGSYTLNGVGVPPTCTVAGHALPK